MILCNWHYQCSYYFTMEKINVRKTDLTLYNHTEDIVEIGSIVDLSRNEPAQFCFTLCYTDGSIVNILQPYSIEDKNKAMSKISSFRQRFIERFCDDFVLTEEDADNYTDQL